MIEIATLETAKAMTTASVSRPIASVPVLKTRTVLR